MKYTPGGTAVCQFGLAVNERKKVGDSWQDVAAFFDVKLWGKTAEVAGEYCRKGAQLVIEGRLSVDQWKDKESGANRSKVYVTGDRIHFCGSRGAEDQRPENDNYGEEPQVAAADVEDPF